MKEKKLVDTDDILKAAKLNKLGGQSAARILMSLLKLNKINKLYSELHDKNGLKFIDCLLKELEVSFEVDECELKRIPTSGPFITISNHPFGGIDGVLLLKIIASLRPDYKVMGNFLLQKIEPVSEFILPVNPFETRKEVKSSLTGIKMAFNHLQKGMPMGIFPAGEVSTYHPHVEGITDRKWQNSIIKFIKKTEVPVIPVYFQGANSRLFHILGLIHPMLRTVKLPSELLNKKNKSIRIRIGNPIRVKDQLEFNDLNQYGRFLRAKTYSLGTSMNEIKKFFLPSLLRLKKPEDIIPPVSSIDIKKEIDNILPDYLLFKSRQFNVICVPSIMIPNIMNEIGRLREITFREIGEGTNRKIDIDEFDLYYHQLFVWDENEQKIVGAYRVGKGKEIINQYGMNGFYIKTLFKINKDFKPVLQEAMELGRSFITREYQRKPMPLFLLWKGILYFLIKNPEYRYLVGPVSISNRFSVFSKTAIIEFIKNHYYNQDFSKYIKPRKEFKVPPSNLDTEILFDFAKDLSKLDRMIEDIEKNIRMPVLLKKYLQLNGKIVGFNIDPKFNDALDGLMVLDLYDVPVETIASLSKEIKDESLLDRFYYNDLYKLSSV
ncbi:MAG: lysophospholipid acyltransferase family protein [Bacteroidales bacterium]